MLQPKERLLSSLKDMSIIYEGQNQYDLLLLVVWFLPAICLFQSCIYKILTARHAGIPTDYTNESPSPPAPAPLPTPPPRIDDQDERRPFGFFMYNTNPNEQHRQRHLHELRFRGYARVDRPGRADRRRAGHIH